MSRYVSDEITGKEMLNWKPGHNILIEGGTGIGKSHFVTTRLLVFAQRFSWKICMFSNRSLLKMQNLRLTREQSNWIECHNYQELEVLSDSRRKEFLSQFQILVMDEAHYFYADSLFNPRTNKLLDALTATPTAIKIYMTATPQVLECYLKAIALNHRYSLPSEPATKIEHVTFYSKDYQLLSGLEQISKKEKAIVFCESAKHAFNQSTKCTMGTAAFICSHTNPDVGRYISLNCYAEILVLERFSARFLFATRALDNGVNIKDKAVTNIAIDMTDDISIIQCLGRKRQVDIKDKYNLWVKVPPREMIKQRLRDVTAQLEEGGRSAPQTAQLEYLRKNYQAILDEGFQTHVCALLGINIFDCTQKLITKIEKKDLTPSATSRIVYTKQRHDLLLPYVGKVIPKNDIPEFCRTVKTVAKRIHIECTFFYPDFAEVRDLIAKMGMGLELSRKANDWKLNESALIFSKSGKAPYRSTLAKKGLLKEAQKRIKC